MLWFDGLAEVNDVVNFDDLAKVLGFSWNLENLASSLLTEVY